MHYLVTDYESGRWQGYYGMDKLVIRSDSLLDFYIKERMKKSTEDRSIRYAGYPNLSKTFNFRVAHPLYALSCVYSSSIFSSRNAINLIV